MAETEKACRRRLSCSPLRVSFLVVCQHVLVLGLRLHEVQRGKKRSFDSAFSGSAGAAGAGAGSLSFAATTGGDRAFEIRKV
jgi:hypothetical protein